MSEVHGTPPQFSKGESMVRIKELGTADQPKCKCSEAQQKKQRSAINIQGYTLISELIFYVHFNQNKPVTSMKMEKHILALLPRENPLNFNLKIISRRMWVQKHGSKGPKLHLLSWIWHLCAEQAQGLEALADGMDVCHPHEHYFTVGVIFCRERARQREESNNYLCKRRFFFIKNILWWCGQMK